MSYAGNSMMAQLFKVTKLWSIKMIVHNVDDKLPEDGQYVVAHRTGTNWHDSTDQEGVTWKVMKFVRGLSLAQREWMAGDDDRKYEHCAEDEGMNNERPFCWQSFGPDVWFGQGVDLWFELPREIDGK